MGAVDAKAGGLGGKFAGLGSAAALGFAAVGAAAVGAGAALVGIGSQFDEATDTIRVRTGATGADLDRLGRVFDRVVQNVPTSFGNASEAIAGLNQRTGLTGPALQRVAEPMLELTRLTGGEISGNVQSLTRLFGDWNVAGAQMPDVLDEVFRASQATGTGVDALAQSAVQFGAPLRQMGFSLEESLALFGKFEAEGVNTSTVLAGMRRGLANFAQDGEAPAEALRRVTDEIKNAGSTADANRLALEVFGTRAGPDMAAAIREGRFELDDMVDAIENGSDSISRASADTMDFGERWTLIKNRVLVALKPAAEAAFNAVGRGMDALGPIVSRAIGWLSVELPPAIERVRSTFEDVFPRVREIFETVVGAISSFWDEHGAEITETLAGFVEGWRSSFDAVRLIVERVFGVISNLWDRFGRQWLGHVEVAFSAILQVIRGAVELIKGVLDVFVGVFTGDWSRAWDGVKGIFSGAWDLIVGAARLAINAVSGVIGAGMAVLSAAWGYVWRGIRGVMLRVWDLIVGNVRTNVNAVRSIVSGAWEAVKSLTSRLWNGIKSAISGALGGIRSAVRTTKNVVETVWEGIKSAFRSPVSAVLRVVVNPFLGFLDRIAGVIGLSVPHSFDLPRFHSGGLVPGDGEVPAVLLGGEGVLNREAMRELGPKGLDALNRGPRRRGTGDGFGLDDVGGILLGPVGNAAVGLTQDLLDGVLSGMRGLIGRIDELIPGDELRRAMRVVRYPLDKLLEFAGSEGAKHVAPAGFGAGEIWRDLWDTVRRQFPTAELFSGLRPGAITATGNPSLHGRGRAIDISPRMDIFDWLAGTYPGSGELIFSPAGGRQIYRGSPHMYGEPTRGDHWDHIHWGFFDSGGWLEPGLTMAYNGTGRPERVVGPGEAGLPVVHVHLEGPIIGSNEAEVERVILAALERARRKGYVRT